MFITTFGASVKKIGKNKYIISSPHHLGCGLWNRYKMGTVINAFFSMHDAAAMKAGVKNFMDPLDLLTKLEGRAQWPKIADS